MTREEIDLVQQSWAQVLAIADTAMELFYERLFELDAEIARLFAGKDMAAQRSHLASAFDLVVQKLHQPETLALPLQELGARHVGYGVGEADFESVGAALLSTLERGLADHWTCAHAQAWAAAWQFILAQVLTGFRAWRAA